MQFVAILLLIISALATIPEPIYNIHYVNSFHPKKINDNLGCGKSVVYGTFLANKGLIDALYIIANPYLYGVANCQHKQTFVKIFGQAQNYQELLKIDQLIENIGNNIGRLNTKQLVIDWTFMPQESLKLKTVTVLQQLIQGLTNKGFIVYVKAPASFFCYQIIPGKKYIIDLPAQHFIIKIYGEEAGRYTTYDSIFGNGEGTVQNGYSTSCPKYPTIMQLNMTAPTKKVYLQKTLDKSQNGYIGSLFQKYLQKAGSGAFNQKYFYDSYPLQQIDL